MKKVLAIVSLSVICSTAMMASENTTSIGGTSGSLNIKDEYDSVKTNVRGFELGHSFTGNEGGILQGNLVIDGSLLSLSGKKDGDTSSEFGAKVLAGNIYPLTNTLWAGPLVGVGTNQYTYKERALHGGDRTTVNTTYGALGATLRFSPVDKLTLGINAYYKKSLIKPQISTNFGSYEDFPKASGYTLEIPVTYKLTSNISLYAKYTKDTMKYSDSDDFTGFTKDLKLLSAGLSYQW